MRLFQAIDGAYYPVSAIKRIGRSKEVSFSSGRKGSIHVVTLVDDATCEIDRYQFESLQEAPLHVFPALPGTALLHYDSDSQEAWPSTVIAWALTGDGGVHAVTPEGLNDGDVSQQIDIQLHDGSVVRQHDQSWKSMADWLAHRAEEAAKMTADPAA